jgi:hypothetical protein
LFSAREKYSKRYEPAACPRSLCAIARIAARSKASLDPFGGLPYSWGMENEAKHLRLRVTPPLVNKAGTPPLVNKAATPPLVNKAGTPPAGGGSGSAAGSDLVRSLGRMLEACRLYGVQHPMAVAAMDDAYALLTLKGVHLTLADKALAVNGTRFEGSGSSAAVVVQTMQESGVVDLRFQAGLSPDQFVKSVLLLTAKMRQTESTDSPACERGRS